jgi:hypothetical protein
VEANALRLDGTDESHGSVEHFYVPGPMVERRRDSVAVLLAAD